MGRLPQEVAMLSPIAPQCRAADRHDRFRHDDCRPAAACPSLQSGQHSFGGVLSGSDRGLPLEM